MNAMGSNEWGASTTGMRAGGGLEDRSPAALPVMAGLA